MEPIGQELVIEDGGVIQFPPPPASGFNFKKENNDASDFASQDISKLSVSTSSSLDDANLILNNPIDEEISIQIKKQRKTYQEILHQPQAATNDFESCVRML